MEGDEDLFPNATPEDLQNRNLDRAGLRVGEALECIERILTIPPGRLPLVNVTQLKKDLLDIHAQIDRLKQKIS
jgi:hypothetical protein